MFDNLNHQEGRRLLRLPGQTSSTRSPTSPSSSPRRPTLLRFPDATWSPSSPARPTASNPHRLPGHRRARPMTHGRRGRRGPARPMQTWMKAIIVAVVIILAVVVGISCACGGRTSPLLVPAGRPSKAQPPARQAGDDRSDASARAAVMMRPTTSARRSVGPTPCRTSSARRGRRAVADAQFTDDTSVRGHHHRCRGAGAEVTSPRPQAARRAAGPRTPPYGPIVTQAADGRDLQRPEGTRES